MADSLSVSILEKKRNEIEAYIATMEKQLAQARTDLAHVNATIRLFDLDETTEPRVYMNLTRMFKRGEIAKLVGDYLASVPDGIADTRQIAAHVMQAKGWDVTDKPLLVSLTSRITHAMTRGQRRGRIARAGKRKGVNLWRIG